MFLYLASSGCAGSLNSTKLHPPLRSALSQSDDLKEQVVKLERRRVRILLQDGERKEGTVKGIGDKTFDLETAGRILNISFGDVKAITELKAGLSTAGAVILVTGVTLVVAAAVLILRD